MARTAWWLAGGRPWFVRSPLACNRLVAGERLSVVTLLPLARSAEALAGGRLAEDLSPLAGTAWLAGEHPKMRLRSEEHSPLACPWLTADECLIYLLLACSALTLAGGSSVAEDLSPLAGTAWLAGEHPKMRLRSEKHSPLAPLANR